MARLGLVARLSDEVWACCSAVGGVHSPSGEEGSGRSVAAAAAVKASRGENLLGTPAAPLTAPTCAKMMMSPTATSNNRSEAAVAQLTISLLFESACPAPLLSRLQCAFSSGSPFWSEHGYFEEGSPYFSYLYDLVRGEGCNGYLSLSWGFHTAVSDSTLRSSQVGSSMVLLGFISPLCPIDSHPRRHAYSPLLPDIACL